MWPGLYSTWARHVAHPLRSDSPRFPSRWPRPHSSFPRSLPPTPNGGRESGNRARRLLGGQAGRGCCGPGCTQPGTYRPARALNTTETLARAIDDWSHPFGFAQGRLRVQRGPQGTRRLPSCSTAKRSVRPRGMEEPRHRRANPGHPARLLTADTDRVPAPRHTWPARSPPG